MKTPTKTWEDVSCPYWDCGWCYAPDDIETTRQRGGCDNYRNCPVVLDLIDKDNEDD